MEKLVKFVKKEDEENEFLTIQKLAKFYVEGTDKANKLDENKKENQN